MHHRGLPESKDIALATSKTWPALSTSDRQLADELTALGHRVRGCPWNAAPITDFTDADVVVLRSNWDYHHDLRDFETWLDTVEASGAALHNSARLVRSFLDKSYLADLEAAGFRVPRTLVSDDFNLETIRSWTDEQDLDHVVVKPAWGASGHGVELVRTEQLTSLVERLGSDPARRPVLIQEFIPAVSSGEIALVYFAGRYSHALLRQPASNDFRVNAQYGGTTTRLDDVAPHLIDLGAKLQVTLPDRATYIRVDVVSDGEDHIVMEVEVNEPALGLHLAPGSAARFAAALLD